MGFLVCVLRMVPVSICQPLNLLIHLPLFPRILLPSQLMSLPPFTTVIHGKPPVKQGVFLNICIEYEPCHSMAPSGTPTIGPAPMPSTTDDCDPLAPPCKHDFLNICYEYWPCADEGNHDSYPTGIVDIFEHNHYNHTHPRGDEPPDGKKGEEDDETEEAEGGETAGAEKSEGGETASAEESEDGETASTEESEEQKETSGSVDKKGKSDEPCEDKKESEDTQTPIEGTPNLK